MAYTGKKPVDFVDVTQSQSMTVSDDLTVDTDTLVVDSANNNVGIGTTSPDYQIDIEASSPTARLNSTVNNGVNTIWFGHSDDADAGAIRYWGSAGGLGTYANAMTFNTNGNQAMHIDSSGNLLVGTTSTSWTNTDGLRYFSGGSLISTLSGGPAAYFNRRTSDGNIAVFAKDGSTVGSIGNSGTNLKVSGVGALLFDHNGSTVLFVQGGGLFPWTDNTKDLGTGSLRYRDIYTVGAVNTSDQNEKQQIASLNNAEIAAAKRISALFKTFKWNDAVELKDDNARTHTGVIAQDVKSALEAEGLDASKYAFWCSNTWWETQTEVPAVAEETDEEGNVIVEAKEAYTRTDTYQTAEEAPEGATERTLQSVRYNELFAFVGAATEQRLASIEARLDALENA
jgi:hypothetical protein